MKRSRNVAIVAAALGLVAGVNSSVAIAGDPLPRVAPGFAIHPYAVIDGAPTSVAFGPAGSPYASTMFVTDLVGGNVRTIDTSLPAGAPSKVFAEGFSSPLGVVVDPQGRVFVADAEGTRQGPFGERVYGRVSRLVDTNADGTADTNEVVLRDLPNGRHNTNGMAFGPDGLLYVANGNSTDDGVEGGDAEVEPWSGAVVRVDPTATNVSLVDAVESEALVAEGMRNLYDVAFSPFDPTQLFIPTNGADDARTDDETAADIAMQNLEDSDDLLYATDVDDFRTIVDPITGEESTEPIIDDFGFPQCLYNEAKRGNLEPYDNPNAAVISAFGPCPKETVVRPLSSFGLHVSANGLAFQTSGVWGEDFRNDVFVAEFGNLFGTDIVGHEVVRVELNATGTEVVSQTEFVSGVVPVDVAFGPDGSMFIADIGGTIYRVTKIVDVPTTVEVSMQNLQFVPQAVILPQGGIVRWINEDTLSHNATGQISLTPAGQGSADEIGTSTFGPGDSEEVRLSTPGVYEYFCTVHPQTMRGTVTVVPSGH